MNMTEVMSQVPNKPLDLGNISLGTDYREYPITTQENAGKISFFLREIKSGYTKVPDDLKLVTFKTEGQTEKLSLERAYDAVLAKNIVKMGQESGIMIRMQASSNTFEPKVPEKKQGHIKKLGNMVKELQGKHVKKELDYKPDFDLIIGMDPPRGGFVTHSIKLVKPEQESI